MTVSAETPRVSYIAAAGQTEFSYAWAMGAGSDIKVFADGMAEPASSYTHNAAAKTVTFNAAPGEGVLVSIVRATAITRATDFTEATPIEAADLNTQADKALQIAQELRTAQGRVLAASEADANDAVFVLPPPDDRADKVVGFNAQGELVMVEQTGSDGQHGQDGARGPMGPPGTSYAGIYDHATEYTAGQMVFYDNNFWVLKPSASPSTDQTPGFNNTAWKDISSMTADDVLHGAGPPAADLGEVGQLYVDTMSGNVEAKIAEDTWLVVPIPKRTQREIMSYSHAAQVTLHRSVSAANLTPNSQDRIYGRNADFDSGSWWRDNEILHGWIVVEGHNLNGDLPVYTTAAQTVYMLLTVKDVYNDIIQFAYPDHVGSRPGAYYTRHFAFNADPGAFSKVTETLSGAAVPGPTLGADGGIYIRTGQTSPVIYLKDSGAWTELEVSGTSPPIPGDPLAKEVLVDYEITSGSINMVPSVDRVLDLARDTNLQFSRALVAADDDKMLFFGVKLANDSNDRAGPWVDRSMPAGKWRNYASLAHNARFRDLATNGWATPFGGAVTESAWERAALVKASNRSLGVIDIANVSIGASGCYAYLQPVSGIKGDKGDKGDPGAAGTTDVSHTENAYRLLDTAALLGGAVLSTQSFTEDTIAGGTQADPIRGYRRAEFGSTTGGTALSDNLPIFMSKLTGRDSDADTYISAFYWHDDEIALAFGADGGTGFGAHFHSDLRIGLVINGAKVWDAAMSDATTSGAGGGDTRFVWTHGSDPFPSASGREFRVLFYRHGSSRGLKYLYEKVELTGDEIVQKIEGQSGDDRLKISALDNDLGLGTGGGGGASGITETLLGSHVWASNTGSSTATFHVAAANWQDYDFIRVIWDNNDAAHGDQVIIGTVITQEQMAATGAWNPGTNIWAAPAVGTEEYITESLRAISGGQAINGYLARAAVNGEASPDLLTLNLPASSSSSFRGRIYGLSLGSSGGSDTHAGAAIPHLDAQEKANFDALTTGLFKVNQTRRATFRITAATSGTKTGWGDADSGDYGTIDQHNLDGERVSTNNALDNIDIDVKEIATTASHLQFKVETAARASALEGHWVTGLRLFILNADTGAKVLDASPVSFQGLTTGADTFSLSIQSGSVLEDGKEYIVGFYKASDGTDVDTAEQILANGNYDLGVRNKGIISFYKRGNSSSSRPAGKPSVPSIGIPPHVFFALNGWQIPEIPGYNQSATQVNDVNERWYSQAALPAGDGWMWKMSSPYEISAITGDARLTGTKWLVERLTHAAQIDH